jgi:hypothetical protein
MRWKQIEDQPKVFALIFETGDEIAGMLQQFSKNQGLGGTSFKAIGALSYAKLGWFNWESDGRIGHQSNPAKSDAASGEHLVIDEGSPIYNEIDTKKLEQSPPDFTVTFTEDKNGFSTVARVA